MTSSMSLWSIETFLSAFGFSANFLNSGRPVEGRQRAGERDVLAKSVTNAHASNCLFCIVILKGAKKSGELTEDDWCLSEGTRPPYLAMCSVIEREAHIV